MSSEATKTVPLEPTNQQLIDGSVAMKYSDWTDPWSKARDCYKAMLAAAPALQSADAELARLEREFVRFYQVAHQASRGSEGPLAVLRSALEWLEAQDWFRRIKEAGDE